jgi:hypothetical protein
MSEQPTREDREDDEGQARRSPTEEGFSAYITEKDNQAGLEAISGAWGGIGSTSTGGRSSLLALQRLFEGSSPDFFSHNLPIFPNVVPSPSPPTVSPEANLLAVNQTLDASENRILGASCGVGGGPHQFQSLVPESTTPNVRTTLSHGISRPHQMRPPIEAHFPLNQGHSAATPRLLSAHTHSSASATSPLFRAEGNSNTTVHAASPHYVPTIARDEGHRPLAGTSTLRTGLVARNRSPSFTCNLDVSQFPHIRKSLGDAQWRLKVEALLHLLSACPALSLCPSAAAAGVATIPTGESSEYTIHVKAGAKSFTFLVFGEKLFDGGSVKERLCRCIVVFPVFLPLAVFPFPRSFFVLVLLVFCSCLVVVVVFFHCGDNLLNPQHKTCLRRRDAYVERSSSRSAYKYYQMAT